MPEPTCPLCRRPKSPEFFRDASRIYHRCPRCFLIHVAPEYLPDREREKAEYDLHRNGPEDLGYRKFLSRLADPLAERLAPGSEGLDFGSGPGPTLSVMLEELGHRVRVFDPFYAPDESVFESTYDFITATEVVEHLHRPGEELSRLWSRLRPGGRLGLMTKLARDREAFAHWHYKNDVTHVSFFSRETFQWLGRRLHSRPKLIGRDVILFQKP